MRGYILVEGSQNRVSAEYCIAVMPRLIHRVPAVDGMQPSIFRQEIVLRAFRIVVITLAMQRMFTLHFLQKNDVGIQLAQPLAQFVQHHAALEI